MEDWRLLYGGAWASLRRGMGLSREDGRPYVRTAIAFGLVPWLVTLALAWIEPGGGIDAVRQVLIDLGVSARLLLAVPLLLLDEFRVDQRIAIILPALRAGGLFAPGDASAWEEQIQRTRARITGGLTLVVLAVLVVLLIAASLLNPTPTTSSGWMVGPGPLGHTWAGLWYTAVARPLFLYLGLFWLWRWLAIALFIWRTSRSPLLLQPSHPDKMGGLAIFMGLGTAAMSIIFTASAVISAEAFFEMAHGAATLKSLAPLMIAYLVLSLVFALGPLLSFAPLLTRLRRRALFLYGVLAAQHSGQFEAKWFQRDAPRDELMGASEISSLTDLASAYFVAQDIRSIPFSRGTLVTVALAAAVPMIPVVLLEVPLPEIVSRIAKFLM